MKKALYKILVADDEDFVRQIYKSILERNGFNVIAAKDGEEAYRIYEREKPDLLLTDVNMPRMGGFELLEKIREHDESLPAIIVSGQRERFDDRSDPRIEFLQKPVDNQTLCERVEMAITCSK